MNWLMDSAVLVPRLPSIRPVTSLWVTSFCGEIVDYGPGTARNLKRGTRVCSVPFLIRADGLPVIGFSAETPGEYGEYIRLTA